MEYGFNLNILYGDSRLPRNPDYPELIANLSCSLELFALRKNISGTAKEIPVLQKASCLEKGKASKRGILGMNDNNLNDDPMKIGRWPWEDHSVHVKGSREVA